MPPRLLGSKGHKNSNNNLSFLYATHLHDLFYVLLHENIAKNNESTKRTQICQRTKMGDNTKRLLARVTILLRETSS